MKFAHIGDCHLGGWSQPELRDLNLKSFQKAIDYSIKEKVDFLIITGDLFDTAYPPIEIIKEAFSEFRKLKESNIPVFLIAGSHDFSASGRTFLEVLEKAGFCKNVALYTEHQGSILLQPTIYKNVVLYGYPGKKSGLEVQEITRIKLDEAPGFFRILMLHTAIRDAVGTLPIEAVEDKKLPTVEYLALSHLHINYSKNGKVYSGPTFPNNIQELEELQGGSFYIFDNGKIRREELKIKKIQIINVEIKNAFKATEDIISVIEQENINDKIIILKISGILEQGEVSNIDFSAIEARIKKKGAYTFLKSTSRLYQAEADQQIEAIDANSLEQEIINIMANKNQNKFTQFIHPLFNTLSIQQIEDEKISIFEDRVYTEAKKILFA